MRQGFTSQMARNIFYGGTVFFILVFVGLILHTETRIPERSKSAEITAEVEVGKVYEGPITKILDFGALVNLLPAAVDAVAVWFLLPERSYYLQIF